MHAFLQNLNIYGIEIISVFVAIFEFCWHAKTNASSDQGGICFAMTTEVRFAVSRGPRRRPVLSRHCGRCQTGHAKPTQPTAYHDYHTYPHQHYHRNVNGLLQHQLQQ